MPDPASVLAKPVSISDDWTFRGFRAVVLENSRVRMTVLPGHGAKVWEFSSKRGGRDLLFHHPRFDVRQPVFGANVDDWWTGGIDEVAPTGHACVIGGENLPFLGEFWSQPWAYEIVDAGPERVVVHLSAGGIITPLRIDRWMELRPDEPKSAQEVMDKLVDWNLRIAESPEGQRPEAIAEQLKKRASFRRVLKQRMEAKKKIN